jgi:hypothetical protein
MLRFRDHPPRSIPSQRGILEFSEGPLLLAARFILAARAAGLEYLWMIFLDDGTGRSPNVREVLVK